jgi:hypothetical protein
MRHAADRLQNLHPTIRRSESLRLPHRELQVPVPHLGVTLLRPDAHLLQRLCKFGYEIRSRRKGEAARVRGRVQGTVWTPDVELGLVGGYCPVPPLREPPEHPSQGAARAPVPGRARVGLRHVAGDHRLSACERERGEGREIRNEADLPHGTQPRGRVKRPARVERQNPLGESNPRTRPPLEGVAVDGLGLGDARMIYKDEPDPYSIYRQRPRHVLLCFPLGLHPAS